MSLFLARFSTKVKWKARQKCRALLTFLPRPLPNQNSAYPPNEMSSHMRALCGVQIHRVLFWLGAAEGAGEVGGAAEARLCRDFFKGAALATK